MRSQVEGLSKNHKQDRVEGEEKDEIEPESIQNFFKYINLCQYYLYILMGIVNNVFGEVELIEHSFFGVRQ